MCILYICHCVVAECHAAHRTAGATCGIQVCRNPGQPGCQRMVRRVLKGSCDIHVGNRQPQDRPDILPNNIDWSEGDHLELLLVAFQNDLENAAIPIVTDFEDVPGVMMAPAVDEDPNRLFPERPLPWNLAVLPPGFPIPPPPHTLYFTNGRSYAHQMPPEPPGYPDQINIPDMEIAMHNGQLIRQSFAEAYNENGAREQVQRYFPAPAPRVPYYPALPAATHLGPGQRVRFLKQEQTAPAYDLREYQPDRVGISRFGQQPQRATAGVGASTELSAQAHVNLVPQSIKEWRNEAAQIPSPPPEIITRPRKSKTQELVRERYTLIEPSEAVFVTSTNNSHTPESPNTSRKRKKPVSNTSSEELQRPKPNFRISDGRRTIEVKLDWKSILFHGGFRNRHYPDIEKKRKEKGIW